MPMNGSQEKFSSNHNNVQMDHLWSLKNVSLHKSFITIGSFDGVHRGHQKIIKKLVTRAKSENSPTAVVTFFPHPAIVLGKRKDPFYITTPEERAQLLGEMGVNFVFTLPFNKEIASISASNFITWLTDHLHPKLFCVGHDFALGKNREGNVQQLQELGFELDYQVEVVEPVSNSEIIISSSLIRSQILLGDLERANLLLGRPFRIWGAVITGDGRGKMLGVPTANLSIWAKRVLPKPGVYIATTQIDKKNYGAVVNIGVRPTFENKLVAPRVEAHVLDFEGNIYHKQIYLDILNRIRDEQRFSSAEALVDQIKRDIIQAKEYFAKL